MVWLVALGLGLAWPAAGGTIYVRADATGANSGANWTDAYTDLQAALAATVAGDEIWVAAGTYKPTTGTDRTVSFVLKGGAGIYGGFAGTETARDPRDWLTNVTILSGDIGIGGDDSDNTEHVVTGAAAAILDGFTIRDGHATGRGGGLRNDGDDLEVANCVFTANQADDSGGAAVCSAPSTTFRNCCFYGNTATGMGGGVFVASGGPFVLVSLDFCTLSGNSANFGGGCATDWGVVQALNSIIWGNAATTADPTFHSPTGGGVWPAYSCVVC